MTDHAQPGAAQSAPVPYTDETYDLRQQAARTMLNYLQRTEVMIARCEATMRDKGSDQFTAANTAVRIMKVGGDITKALMLAAFGETRHRSIREAPPSREPAPRTQTQEDLDATTAVLAREMRALSEECVKDWEKDRKTSY